MKLHEICIERPVFTIMLVMSLVVLGYFSFISLGIDLFPKVDFPMVTIRTTLKGASPEEVETSVTKPIEEAVNTIGGIDELRSVSYEGLSQVVVTFVLEKNTDVGAQEVRDKVATIVSQFPEGTDPSIIEKIDPDASPILNIAVSSTYRDPRDITYLTKKKIKEPLETQNGVGSVTIVGGAEREIHVVLNPDKLKAYQISVNEVKGAIQSQNIEVPGGRIDAGKKELVVRTLGRITKPADFEKIIVKNINGVSVKISDIGHVLDTEEEQRSLARYDGARCVSVVVKKQSGTNTVAVINGVKGKLEDIKKLLPKDFRVEVVSDQSFFIQASVDEVMSHLKMGAILASVVVLLFMGNFFATIIAALAIPTSIIATFTLIQWMGFTLNNMTLLGLTLAVGIVIDDAIVVLENIFRHVEEHGEDPVAASKKATSEIALAVMATTLSLVIIFLPLAYMQGIIGRFMKSFGLTMAFSIMVSLLVSFTLTPMLCAKLFKKKAEGHAKKSSKDSAFYGAIDKGYGWMLRFAMRHRFLMVMLAIVTILSTVPLMKVVGKDFMPADDQNEFQVDIKAPEGTSIHAMDETLKLIEDDVKRLRGVKSLLTSIGGGEGRNVNQGQIYVKLIDMKERKFSQFDVMNDVRKLLKRYPGLRTSVVNVSMIGSRGFSQADVNFNVRGPDLSALQEYVAQIMAEARKVPGLVDIDSSYDAGKPEIDLHINRDKAAALGVGVSDIAFALRTMVGGEEDITKYKEGDDLYEVRLRVDKVFRDSAKNVAGLFVPSLKSGEVRLDNVVDLIEGTGPARIDRQDRQRQITVVANLDKKPLGYAMDTLNSLVKKMNLPPTYVTDFGGKAKRQGETYRNFGLAFLLSFIFMYMILASQFESFLHPITILLSLPLAIPFAILSLVLTGQTLHIMSILGIFMLFGVVKKNSILQVDYTNTLRKQGMARDEAIIEASHARLRPILMTTIVLVAAMLPVVFGKGAGSGTRSSMGIVIVGGQLLCLLITLLVTPVCYSLFDDLSAWFKRVFLRRSTAA